MSEDRVTEKVYCHDHPSAYNNVNSAMLAALLNKNDNPLEAAALMNGGMGGQWNNPFIYLVWMMFARRMWGNVTPSTNFLTRLNLMKHFSLYVFQRIIGTMRSKEVPEARRKRRCL